MRKWLWLIPLFFLLICAIRPISEPDLFFYYALVEHFLKTGQWPVTDPFVYTLPNDKLMTLHQWLGYWIYYGLYPWIGWAWPILLETFLLLTLFTVPLLSFWRRRRDPPAYFAALWTVAIFAAHHRFRERVSLFGDLFIVTLSAGLVWCSERIWFWYSLPFLFLAWAQLHPSYPLGWIILFCYCALNRPWTWPKHRWIAVALCFVTPFLNPMGAEGVFYPFTFTLNIEPLLQKYIVEWLPLTDPRLFPFKFLYIPFITLIPWTAYQVWRNRKLISLFELFLFVLSVALTVKSVRFGLAAQGLILIVLSTLELKRENDPRPTRWPAIAVTAAVSLTVAVIKLAMTPAAFQPISERFQVDSSYFPVSAVNFLNQVKPKKHIFHSFGYGGYLAFRWQGEPPIFFHGFSTNFKFYEDNYYHPQESRAQLDALIAKWDLGVFLITKLGNDNPFINILSQHPDWQKIYEDQACYIFVRRDPAVFAH